MLSMMNNGYNLSPNLVNKLRLLINLIFIVIIFRNVK